VLPALLSRTEAVPVVSVYSERSAEATSSAVKSDECRWVPRSLVVELVEDDGAVKVMVGSSLPHTSTQLGSPQTKAAVMKQTPTQFGKRTFSVSGHGTVFLQQSTTLIVEQSAFRQARKSHLFYCAFIARNFSPVYC